MKGVAVARTPSRFITDLWSFSKYENDLRILQADVLKLKLDRDDLKDNAKQLKKHLEEEKKEKKALSLSIFVMQKHLSKLRSFIKSSIKGVDPVGNQVGKFLSDGDNSVEESVVGTSGEKFLTVQETSSDED